MKNSSVESKIITHDQPTHLKVVRSEFDNIFRGLKADSNWMDFYQDAIRLKEAYFTLAESNKHLVNQMLEARRIQENLAPEWSLVSHVFKNSFIFNTPKSIISGDFFWHGQSENLVYFALADCPGHGLSGGLLTVAGQHLFNDILKKNKNVSSAELFFEATSSFSDLVTQIQNTSDGLGSIEFIVCTMDISQNKVALAGSDRMFRLIKKNGDIQGENENEKKGFKTPTHSGKEYQFEKGDCLYLFSNGYPDQFGGQENIRMKSNRFNQLLRLINHLGPVQQKKVLQSYMKEWKGAQEQTDDILLIKIGY